MTTSVQVGDQRHTPLAPQLTGPSPRTRRPRAVRLPAALIFSTHHSDLAVYLYALIDVTSGREQGPAAAGRDWFADRADASVSGVAKALGQLCRPHTGKDDLTPDSPVYVTSRRRGHGLTACRDVVRGIPPVWLSEDSIGTGRPVVSVAAWRLYAAYLYLRHPEYGTVRYSRDELAQMLHRRPKTITALAAELVDAGLVLVREVPGKRSVIAPVLELSAAGRAAAAALLDAAVPARPNGSDRPARPDLAVVHNDPDPVCDQPDRVDNPPDPVDNLRTPGSSAGTSGGSSAGTSGGSSAGTSLERVPGYSGPNYQDPSSGPPAAAARGGPDRTRRVVPVAAPAAARVVLSVSELARRGLPPWCGRCPGPAVADRVELDAGGHRTRTPCRTCGPGDQASGRVA
jgi:hypothetical protein